ncbi:MAG: TRAP transporter TatT component family protein [Arenicellales bacterium]
MRRYLVFSLLLFSVAFATACSPKRYALNTLGDMLSKGGSVYESDNDIILIGEALPFSLKLLESLLVESPDQPGLLLSASRGYVLYAYAYVHWQADLEKLFDIENARVMRERAQNLYLRALNYSLHALELSHPGFENTLATNPQRAVLAITSSSADSNVPLLYWSAAALGLAISVSKNDPRMLARLPEVGAMLDRALTLDEDWNRGTLHEFKITWAAAQHTDADESILRDHYNRALELSDGERASLFVTMAEAISLPNQDREEFTFLLENALAVDPDNDPEHRLLNVIAQRRAKWLLSHIDELIL